MSTHRFDRPHRIDSGRVATPEPAGNPDGGWISWGEPGLLSIVVPAKDEAESLPMLVAEIALAFRPLLLPRPEGPRLTGYEIVVVDDGSTDSTRNVLTLLRATHPELRPVRLVRNVGQSAATLAGFREARGEWIAVLDADLQNRPADLAALWDALPGHDAALGWRMKREDVWSKRFISRWANRVRNLVLGQSIIDTGCSVRIFSREMALRLPTFKGFHRFLGPLLLREGCRVVQVPVTHRPRSHGKSNYNFWNRSYQVLFDLLGVAWLMRRGVGYELALTTPSPHPFDPNASRVRAPHASRSSLSKSPTSSVPTTRQEAA